MAAAAVCPVLGTTNTVLPPAHPDFDPSVPGQVCPITKATTDHHHNLTKHPSIPGASISNAASGNSFSAASQTPSAAQCPALSKEVAGADAQTRDEEVCPVVGAVTTVLPPGHPSVEGEEQKTCPVTNATLMHHKGKVVVHPVVADAEGKVCPVVGARGKAIA